MPNAQRTYVKDLRDWDLPRLEALERAVTREIARTVTATCSDPELQNLCVRRARALAAVAVNEVIEYWLQGLADGNGGRHPEFTMELPYLDAGESVDCLTIAYCVDNEDGTRMELNRTTLERVLLRVQDTSEPPSDLHRRIRSFAAELRALAARLDAGLSTPARSRLD